LIDEQFLAIAHDLLEAGRYIDGRGWVPATSGNFSARLDAERIAITVSGRHKGRLTADDFMVVDLAGNPLTTGKRPSAETLLHTQLYAHDPAIGAVLHTHSRNATVLSRRLGSDDLVLEGYELLKAFPGVTTHEIRVTVPVYPNEQDIPRLAGQVQAELDSGEPLYGYLIAGHGLYTWGATVEETLRHIEAFEFLFECELEERRG